MRGPRLRPTPAAMPVPPTRHRPRWPMCQRRRGRAHRRDRRAALLRGTVLARGGHRRLQGRPRSSSTACPSPRPTPRDGSRSWPRPGRHRLQAIASGISAADVTGRRAAGGWTGEVRLTPGGRCYETVVAAKPPWRAVSRRRARRRGPRAGTGGDPFRVIESLPGVSQVVWPFALYAIRGANPGNTGFFLDGMRVPALFHFALGPSIVHPYLIDKLSFYPGGYPARLGGYVSGAVAAETAAPPHDIARFTADVRALRRGRAGRDAVGRRPRHRRRRRPLRLHGADRLAPVRQRRLRLRGLSAARRSHARRRPRDAAGARVVRSASTSRTEHRRRVAELPPPRPALGAARRRLAAARARPRSATDDAQSQLYDSPIARARLQRSRRGVAYRAHAARRRRLEIGVDAEAQRFDTDVDFRRPRRRRDAGAAPTLLADLARTRNALSRARATSPRSMPLGRLTLEPGLRYAQYFEQGVTRGAFEPRLAVRLGDHAARSASTPPSAASRRCPACPSASPASRRSACADFGLQTSTQAALGVEARLPADLTLRLTGFHQWLLRQRHAQHLRSRRHHARIPRRCGTAAATAPS